MARSSEPDLDQLYQVPLSEFIAERNALAKRAGPRAADVRSLQKPSLPAWAINQLFWRKREIYDELIERADDLRATHQAAVRGRTADLRGAGRSHEDAVERALKATLALLAESGHPVTDATKQAIATTLRALPSDEAPGRLSRQLQPRGFDVLGRAAAGGRVRTAPPPVAFKKPERTAGKVDQKGAAARAAARESASRDVSAAVRATRDAEQAARRQEFEAARAARDIDKADRRVAAAEEALRQAESELEDAKRAATIAVKAQETVQARAAKAADALARAREREEAVRRKLDDLS
jgi:hypothetical protein